jgi:hypothetical protein
MSGNDFLFSLFTLLLGFILVEVLSGLMRTLRARLPSGPGIKAEVHIGWLTPLLGTYTMLNVLLWWGTLYGMLGRLPVGYDTMTIGLILCSLFYFAASTIFPDDARAWPDVDEWFWMHRRQVLGCILAANLPWMLEPFVLEKLSGSEMAVNLIVEASQLLLLLLAILARPKGIVTGALAGLVAIHLSFIPLDYLHRHGVW